MNKMFIFHFCEDLHNNPFFGKVNVRFTETEEELDRALTDRDCMLARGSFDGQIPICDLIEMYVKRADCSGPGPNGNDWVFENAWAAPVTREEAYRRLYGEPQKIY